MPSAPLVEVRTVKFDINQLEIGGFTRSSRGMVTRWGVGLTTEMKELARAGTLRGTQKWGRAILANSYTVVIAGTGETECEIRVRNRQKYAKYVFLGTRPVITATGGGRMPVGKSQLGLGFLRVPNDAYITPKAEVRGQKGHNYPLTAMRLVMSKLKVTVP
jgi:hypothetical protein